MLSVADGPHGGQRDHRVCAAIQRHPHSICGRKQRGGATLGEHGGHDHDDIVRVSAAARLGQMAGVAQVKRIVLGNHAGHSHGDPSLKYDESIIA